MNRLFSMGAIGLSLLFCGNAQAVTPTAAEVAKLVAGDGVPMDAYGYAVAVDGDTAVIGAYGDDDLGSESGSAYVYVRDAAGVWNLVQKLTASDGVADDRFGWAVALHGDIAVIGIEGWDFDNPPLGAAYVFSRDGAGVWTERQKLTAFDGAPGDYFGASLAVNGNSIVVGARGDDGSGTLLDVGAAYVFTSDSSGVWSLQQKLSAPSSSESDGFGGQVDVEADTAVIAASGADAAYVFTRDSTGTWAQRQTLSPADATGNGFGKSVSLNGDYAVIGAFLDDQSAVNAGAAYVFGRNSAGVWSQQQKLVAGDAADGDYFGFSVDLDGTELVVGAGGVDDNGTDAGAVYLFSRDSSGAWNERLKLLASDGVNYDYLGYSVNSVRMSGSTVLAGAYLGDTTLGVSTGSAYVFDVTTEEGPTVSVSTTALDFGEVLVGQTATRILTVSNTGTADLTLSGIAITSGVDFSLADTCPSTLAPSAACEITVSFTPTVTGGLSDVLTISSDDPDQPSINVALSGTGITDLPDLMVTALTAPSVLSVGTTYTMEVTVANQGTMDVTGGHWMSLYLGNTLLVSEFLWNAPAAGASTTLSLSVTIPRMQKGVYTLKATADVLEWIPELDETNNSLTRSVSVTPF